MEYSVYEFPLLLLLLSLSVARARPRTQTHSETAPEVLIIQAWPLCNPVLQLRWDDIKRLPLPFELALFCWEFDRSGEEEEEPCLAILSAEPTSRPRLGSHFAKLTCPFFFLFFTLFFFLLCSQPASWKVFWRVVRIMLPHWLLFQGPQTMVPKHQEWIYDANDLLFFWGFF